MLRKDMAQLDLELLELKMKLRAGALASGQHLVNMACVAWGCVPGFLKCWFRCANFDYLRQSIDVFRQFCFVKRQVIGAANQAA
jgi:hypothetical protein